MASENIPGYENQNTNYNYEAFGYEDPLEKFVVD